MVWRAERTNAHQTDAAGQQASHGVDLRDGEGLCIVEWREDAREPAGEHRLAASRRARQQDVVATGGGHFERSFGRDLAADVRPTRLAPKQRRLMGRLHGWPAIVAQRSDHVFESARGTNGDTIDHGDFCGVGETADHATQAAVSHHLRDSKDAAHWSDLSGKRQFSKDDPTVERVERNLVLAHENAERDGQIEVRPFFAQVCRREIDDDATIRKRQA